MTERTVFPYRFAPVRESGLTFDALLKDRNPCAVSSIALQSQKTNGGRIGFYSTPMGTAVEVVLHSFPTGKVDYEPCFIEIEEKKNSRYRNITANLPPVFVRGGEGRMTFLTDRFSAADVIGKRIWIKSNGGAIASGMIFSAERPAYD